MTSKFVHLSAVTLVAALLSAPAELAAQGAYTVQGFGPNNNGYGFYPQAINEAGDVAGYFYDNNGGTQRAFVYRGGVFTTIGTFGGNYSYAVDMNGSGAVVGYSYVANNSSYHAFLFDGTLHDLGTLGGSYSYANAVNASGQVVGNSDGYAFRYSNGAMQRLVDLLPAGSGWTQLYDARDINDAGQIIGRGCHNTTGCRPFLFTPASGVSPATIVGIGSASQSAEAQWINSSGQVAGRIYDGSWKAFLYTPATGTLAIIPGLGGNTTYPQDLNDAGQVVGYSYLPNNSTYRAFLYSNGQTSDLGTAAGSTSSQATAINNDGVVLGYSNGSFVYSGGVMRQVRNLADGCNWSVSDARAINDAGQIAGYGYEPGVGYRGFILTPVVGQSTTTLVASNVSGPYAGAVQLQARLTSACSSLNGRSVSFSLNGTAVGSAQTGDDGWARLSTSLGTITTGTYPDGLATTFVGDPSFPTASDTAALTVFRANPILTWNPAALVEGTPLGSSQLNAAADVPGTFSYSPGAGSTLGSGLRRLNVTFFPVDTTNYNARSSQALLAVRASNPAFSFTAREINSLGGTHTEVLAFNNLGHATGYSYRPANSEYHAFLFSNGVTTDLGTLGGRYSYARDINDASQVTGWAHTTSGYQSAFLYSASGMIDLGAMVRVNDYSEGMAINATGDVALRARNNSGYYHAFLYSNGTMTDLGALAGGYNESYPTDINASRQVVGYSYPNTNCYHAFLATTSGMQDLGTLGGNCSQATAINDAGHVIGWAQDASGQQRAFVYKNGQMIDLGTLGGNYATATAINNQGVITGWSYTANNNQLHAFRYENGVMTDLGVINYQSEGRDINDSSAAVGWSYTPNFDQTAFLHASGAMHDLNALINVGETAGVNEARFINDPGQILARGSSTGTNRWYVLTPTTLASSSLTLAASAGVYRGTTTLTATLSIADPAGAPVQFKLNGSVVGTAQADANGVARLENVSLGNINAGTHTAGASASYWGDANYAGSTAAADLVISKAVPAITWPSPAAITHPTGLSGTQLNATTTVAGTFAFSPAVGTILPAGDDQTLQVTFTPSDTTNYAIATASVLIDVLKRTPSVTWSNPAGIVYGTLLGATQLNATASVPGTFTYSPAAGTQLNVGSNQVLSVAFTPTDTTSYNAVPVTTVSINVSKATPTVTWTNPAGIVYGAVLGANELNATASVPGTFAYSPAAGTTLNAGNQVLAVAFTPTDTANYNSVSATTVSINVSKATPTVSWANPADIVYGTLLSASQLNATASTDGTFTYTPATGAKLNAGDNQSLAVAFTPNDTANYNSVPVTSVSINVRKGTPTVSWNHPGAIVYGTALGATQLNASASVPGQLVYAPAAGTVLNAGDGQSLSVTFTPDDAANYDSPPVATVLINVEKATPTVNWSNPVGIAYGTLLSGTQLNATASVPGSLTYTPALGAKLNAGNQVLSVAFTPNDGANYKSVPATTVTINVSKVTPTVSWSNPAGITYGTALGAAQLNAAASVPGAFTYTPAAGTQLSVGDNQVLSVSFTPTDATNYDSVPVTTVTINVAKGTPAVNWANPANIVYGTALGAAQLNASAGVPGQFVYTPALGTVLNAGAGQTLSVVFTPTDTANYNGSVKSVVLTVTPAPLTITAVNKSMLLNGVMPALTATYSGFVNGDTSASLTTAVALATAATGATVGAFPITASGAVHANYNIMHVPGTLSVSYATDACLGEAGHQVLNPLNADGSSVVRRNSTVPVKFRVCDANGNSIGTPGVVSSFAMIQVLSGTVSGDLEEVVSTTPDSSFRWDPSGQQWIFNLSTKSQSANRTYVYRITLADLSVIEFRYGVR